MVVKTIAYHVSEKTHPEFLVHMPSVSDVYQTILAANDGKVAEVVLMPEYNAHESWADEQAWIIANFQGIPVMVDAAGGWDPAQYVTPERLQALIAADVDVRWIRISELVSYYEEWLHLPFPTAYVVGVLEFCRANSIKVYLCEWKIAAFDALLEVIEGYEDVVWLGFKTNSGDMEPSGGFKYLVDKLRGGAYPHPEQWGATIESWYWETRHRGLPAHPDSNVWNPDNMPVSFMVCHMQEAATMPTVWYSGAEILQCEAYWWFFEHTTGKPRKALETIHKFLNSLRAVQKNSTVILETLYAEWIGSPVRTDILWLDGRASTIGDWEVQPSQLDFKNSPKKYAVSCYSFGESGNRWVRTETVAVEVLVKTLGTTLEKAAFVRDTLKAEVERILYMYGRLGPLWDPGTGIGHKRVVPGLIDVSIVGAPMPLEDANFSRITVQVKCMFYPKKLWVTKP